MLHSGLEVELVDITAEICAPLEPDKETLKIIKQIIATPPLPEPRLSHHHSPA